MNLEKGTQAPEFTLPANNGKDVSLKDYAGKNVVLYFYPKDMTPGCTSEACDFRDNHQSFKELDTVILGVSADPVDSHEKFIDKYDLPFLLLADENFDVAEKYGALKVQGSAGDEKYGMERSTFIIDKDGVLQEEFRQVKVEGHVEEALSYIKENLES
ncbi:peroxiredoxin [Salimicrobium jeotgali]|uniref:thioredoxin-dependent peroxiredoxin n=2 Tax=Salimicrobium TaxID=351195 RepID=K2GEB2_9BACI|nr:MULTISPECIES: thioredoxin-dependent thiol peroxidase [Salimicrobium]AKG05078.1 peroxiredoxin [Salimicrobium jeotgali]EKE32562.1 peroxiredoxin YgaF [Salimicrobium jeotgali]MBM7695455.1 peroxiredoxin Q/BCP [Salimicrobium jeotgali]SIS99869.1 peroxiredoxin Q/BCP [Salimicrobium salexigens]